MNKQISNYLAVSVLTLMTVLASCKIYKPNDNDFVAVTAITGIPMVVEVNKPTTFAATVSPPDATNKTVTWTIKNARTTGATFTGNVFTASAVGTVTVTATIANGVTTTAPFATDFTISVKSAEEMPVVTGVTVSPANVSVAKGKTKTFSATVTGSKLEEVHKTVNWSVTGGKTGTVIAADGTLTVADDETATSLTVKATSSIDAGKSGTASVSIISGEPKPLTQIKKMIAVYEHTVVLKADGTVWTWGDCFGDRTSTDKTIPAQVIGLTGVVAVATAGSNVVVLKSDGTVWAWGFNRYGNLGNGVRTDSSTPVQVLGLTEIVAVTGRAALKSDGTVWCWGPNLDGQIGNGTTSQTGQTTPIQVRNLTEVITIASGGSHNIALKADGTVWAWGNNLSGEIGDGTSTNRYRPVQVSGLTGVKAIATAHWHNVALKTDGTVWCWGYNNFGQIGDGTTTTRRTPVQVSGLSGITAIEVGNFINVAIKTDGTAWAWGRNNYGQIGDGTTTDRYRPVQVSCFKDFAEIGLGFHTVVIKTDGTVWTWGKNQYGQLGDGTKTDRPTPAKIPCFNINN